ncbi:hypothetical protein VS873_24030, partial [Salmonella enterica subsp. enterica serovar Typhi]|nr:hypothetical protein [Salmonella enterica subsp. enterica serovar Typhi]
MFVYANVQRSTSACAPKRSTSFTTPEFSCQPLTATWPCCRVRLCERPAQYQRLRAKTFNQLHH